MFISKTRKWGNSIGLLISRPEAIRLLSGNRHDDLHNSLASSSLYSHREILSIIIKDNIKDWHDEH